MGLSASMWTSVSGLLMHGEKMNVVGNNLANVSTVGFKAQRMDFQDFVYNNSFSASGTTQIGRGVTVAAVLGDFSQGSFETTNDATDLGISGKGFFQVKDPNSDQVWYTRAGDFRFNKEGYLNNPQGYHLQGWKIDNRDNPSLASGSGTNSITSGILRSGSPTDVRFDTWTVPPKQTTKVSFQQYLSTKAGNDKAISSGNPAFSLLETWDGSKTVKDSSVPPISSTGYAATSSMKIYDEAGTSHTLTTYYDQVSGDSIQGLPNGYKVYEYMVTVDPSEDNRTFGGTYDPKTGQLSGAQSFKDTKMAGVMMVGQLIFDGSGNLVNQTAYTYNATKKISDADLAMDPIPMPAEDPTDLKNWQPTQISNNGLPVFTANFSGMPFANSVQEKQPDVAEKFNQKDSSSYLIEFDLGISNTSGNMWNDNTGSMGSIDSTRQVYDERGNLLTQVQDGNSPANVVTFTTPGDYAEFQRAVDAAKATADSKRFVWDSTWEIDDITGQVKTSGGALVDRLTAADGTTSIAVPSGSAADIRAAIALQNTVADKFLIQGTDKIAVKTDFTKLATIPSDATKRGDSPTKASGDGNSTMSAVQNGYASGNLNNYTVDQSGILYGIYSNGVTMPLYQIALYDFTCTEGLRREGGNLFSATMESGNPKVGPAGENGMGTIQAYSIEQSNVDMAREFVQMITTQRGFQSNSKGITTTDTMLETVINMKR